METNYIEEGKYYRAQKEVGKLKAFYWHVIIYFSIIATVISINLKVTPESHWFWYAVVGGGIPLIVHALKVYIYNAAWEEKKMQMILRKKKTT